MRLVPYGRQAISDQDITKVEEVLKGDWLTTGPEVDSFESALHAFLGIPTVVVSSGTAALHCAYKAIGLEQGDEIISPPLTFIATQATAVVLGATVIFADVDPVYGLIDPIEVRKKITSKTKAIVTVDYAGVPSPLIELKSIAEEAGVFLIQDASHSIGSEYYGRRVGSQADITTFSFFPTKNITTTEGGALSSPNPQLLQRAREFSRQGLVRDSTKFRWPDEGAWHQEVHEFGLNYRLSDVGAALGKSQLSRILEFKQIRKNLYDKYLACLGDLPGIVLPSYPDNTSPMWHLFPIRVPAELRKGIFDDLRRAGIGVQVNYFPVHLQPVFLADGYSWGSFPVAEAFYRQELSLPMHTNLEFFTEQYFSQVHTILSSYLS
jgi:dTDP-4-amino-4,6-dideoxygalactose transaminase